MANFVIKRDGTKEPFDAEKIRRAITGASQRTALPEERKKEVIEQVLSAALQLAREKEEIKTSELKEKILSELDAIEPSVSGVWRKYAQEKGGV